ncbi:flavin-dependent monooxygenase QhpG [Roseivivax sp. CAU 1761]
MDTELAYDVAIAGAGPAGAVAATLLARGGRRVALVAGGAGPGRVEGMAPRLVQVLEGLGLPAEGVGPARQRQVRWGDERGARNVEHAVARATFDEGLRRAAEDAGATLFAAPVAALDPAAGRLTLADGRVLRAARLVEARGRRASWPARRGTRAAPAPATLAVAGWVPAALWPVCGARLEARPEGWTWAIDAGEGRTWMQAVGDARLAAGHRGRAAHAALWASVLGAGAPPLPEPALCHDIAPRLTAPRFDARCLRLGDAAMALDPLSGHGLFWAVSSALMLPPILAALDRGEDDLAAEFYTARVVETARRQARIGRDFYREVGGTTPFWTARAGWPADAPAHDAPARPRLVRRVVVAAGRLTRREVLVSAQEPGGAAFVAGIDLAPVLRRLAGRPLPEPARFGADILPDRPPETAARLHRWLAARGLGAGFEITDQSDRGTLPCGHDPSA